MDKPYSIGRGRFLKFTGLGITCATLLAAGPRGEAQDGKPASPAAPIVKTGEMRPQNDAAPVPRPPKPIADVAAMTGNASLAQTLRQTLETTVLFSQPGDGRIWARGLTYKASFGTEGFTYIPFLGASAPRSYPIGLTVASVTVNGAAVSLDATAMPSIQGQRITFNRGLVSEVYDLSPQAIEQTFVLNQQVQGAVQLRLAVASDMAMTTKDGAITLDVPDNLGHVLYDQAAAVDAAQHRTPLTMALQNGQIAIDVPASVVAKAKGMLSIDPVLSSIATVNNSMNEADADVGFEPLSNHYCVAFEHQFSVTDHDIYSILMSNSGSVIVGSTATIDATGSNWRHPRVAGKYSGSQFLVVAQVGNAPTRAIWGTERDASLNTVSGQFQVSDPIFAGDQHDPDVGGDPYIAAPTFYLVAWERDFSLTDHDILARRVNETATTTGAVILIDNTTASIDDLPSISSSDGAGLWLVAWEHQFNPTDHDIYGSILNFGGAIVHATFTIDASFLDTRAVSVSTLANDGTFAVAYNYGDFDLRMKLVDAALATLVAEGNLQEIGGDPFNQVQRNPSIDSDGDKITVAFSEQFVANDWDIWIQAFCRNGSFLREAEPRRVLDFTQDDDRTPRLVGRFSGGNPAKDSMTVWHSGGAAGLGNVYASTYRTPFVCCPADIAPLGGNGIVNIDDLVQVILQWSDDCITCNGDVDGNLQVNIDDLVKVITSWGPCP